MIFSWIDHIAAEDKLMFMNEFDELKTTRNFLHIRASANEEGMYSYKGVLDADLLPDGRRLCYQLNGKMPFAIEMRNASPNAIFNAHGKALRLQRALHARCEPRYLERQLFMAVFTSVALRNRFSVDSSIIR